MLLYPECPDCGKAAHHRPVDWSSGEVSVYVRHEHRGCDTHRYAFEVDGQGETQSRALRGGEKFEEYRAKVAC